MLRRLLDRSVMEKIVQYKLKENNYTKICVFSAFQQVCSVFQE